MSSSLSFFILLSRQLLDTWWIGRESSCLLDSFSTPSGSIELLFLHLMDCSSIPLDTCIYWALLRVYIFILRDPILISSISLDLSTRYREVVKIAIWKSLRSSTDSKVLRRCWGGVEQAFKSSFFEKWKTQTWMQSNMQLNQWSKHHINLLKSSLNINFMHMDPKNTHTH